MKLVCNFLRIYVFVHLFVSGLSWDTRVGCSFVLRDACSAWTQLWHSGSAVACRLQSELASVISAHGLSSPSRGQTWVPCITRWILNHWATREIPIILSWLEVLYPFLEIFAHLCWRCWRFSSVFSSTFRHSALKY